MSFSTRLLRTVAPFSALLLVLAACDNNDTTEPDTEEASESSDPADSGISEDPASALKDAVAAIADWDGVALELSFQADDAARASLVAEDPDEEEMIDLVLNSSLSMIAVGDEDEGAVQLAVNVDGSDVFELYLGAEGDTVGTLALRVDVPTILDLVDDPEAAAEVNAMLGQAALFGLQDAADALAEGEWVAISGVDDLSSMMMEDLADAEEPEVDDEQAQQIAEAVAERTEAFIDTDVDVSHVGSDAAGERLRVVAEGPAIEAYLADLVDIFASHDLVDGFDAMEFQDELEDLPAEGVTVDIWVSGGEVSQFAIDIAQLEGEEELDIDGEFLLVIGLANHTGGLPAPNATTTVDVMSLFGQFMGGMGDFDFDEDLGDFDEDFNDELDQELSQEEIDMMLQFMECVSEEELESFGFFMPELAEAAEQAIADGTLELC